jgi:hypothetical protein
MKIIDWSKSDILKIGNEPDCRDKIADEDVKSLRDKIEPWLTAVFQSEHLSLLAGVGLTKAITSIASVTTQGMERLSFSELGDKIKNTADSQAKALARGKANFEDDLSVAMELYKGLLVQGDEKSKTLKDEIEVKLAEFIENILTAEREFFAKKDEGNALSYLKSFIISFASRTASRERLQIFTTNYDRFIEYACDKAGVLILDRFIGKISPVFRTNKLELDYHYNPPGIRGEPRYVEGVIKYTKLHGSLDWRFSEEEIIKSSLPFGADNDHPDVLEEPFEHVVIYPNSSKGIETVFYPYSELFRDLSSAICRPNSVVVTYGYGFGDSHVNRILKDMLTSPSTHLVIISWDIADNRIQKFVEQNNQSQFTLLIGNHFGNLKTLVENYLPKAAIDKISEREQRYREKTGRDNPDSFGKIEL